MNLADAVGDGTHRIRHINFAEGAYIHKVGSKWRFNWNGYDLGDIEYSMSVEYATSFYWERVKKPITRAEAAEALIEHVADLLKMESLVSYFVNLRPLYHQWVEAKE